MTKEEFKSEVTRIANHIRDMLITKNESYGDSALNPLRVFSKLDSTEQIKIRIDDKLSRISRGFDVENEDTIDDLIGYLILLKISRKV